MSDPPVDLALAELRAATAEVERLAKELYDAQKVRHEKFEAYRKAAPAMDSPEPRKFLPGKAERRATARLDTPFPPSHFGKPKLTAQQKKNLAEAAEWAAHPKGLSGA